MTLTVQESLADERYHILKDDDARVMNSVWRFTDNTRVRVRTIRHPDKPVLMSWTRAPKEDRVRLKQRQESLYSPSRRHLVS